MKKNIKIIVLVFVLTAFVGALFLLDNGKKNAGITSAQAAEMEMDATSEDSAGVDINSAFILKSSAFIDSVTIKKNLSVEPKTVLEIKEGKNDGEKMIVPKEPLEAGQVYRFTLNMESSQPLKWAFQTKGDFRITGSLPRNQATGIPVDTGIEINFSHLNFADPADYFEISPKVKGRFEVHKKTLAFIPEGLQPATIYTVKIKKGLCLQKSSEALEEDYIFSFETQEMVQEGPKEYNIDILDQTMEFTPGEQPVIPVGYYSFKDSDVMPDATVSIYRYKDAGSYINQLKEREKIPFWAYASRRSYLEDTTQLEKEAGFSVQLKRFGYETFLEFPNTLAPGFYLADIAVKNTKRQLWFQVSDMGVYAVRADNKIMVWVHNLSDGSPGTGARVKVEGRQDSFETDSCGLAEIPSGEEYQNGVYLTVEDNGECTVAALVSEYYLMQYNKGKSNMAQSYWKYFYLDRGLYKPDDVVNFWGLIKPRDNVMPSIKEVTVSLTRWDGRQETAIMNQDVELDGISFTGSMKLPNLIPGYYNMVVLMEGEPLMQRGIDVERYTKPSYKISAQPEKKAVFAGDSVNFNISARCFEDTPVPNLSLGYSLETSGEIETDGKGNAVLPYTPKYDRQRSSSIENRYLFLNAVLPECGEITGGVPVTVLNNDVDISVTGKIKSGSGQLEIELKRLTADKVNRGEADPWDKDAFTTGAAAGRVVKISLFRQEWDKIEDGEYYDFINKRVEQRYTYRERKVPAGEGKVVTDSAGKAKYVFDAEPKKSYLVEITSKDYRGNEALREIYLPGDDVFRAGEYQWYFLESEQGRAKYRDGAKIQLRMKNNGSLVSDREKSFLFIEARAGILESRIQDSGLYTSVFNNEDIPNFWVRGVFFDGRFYHETADYLAAFDEQEKGLEIKVDTDKDEYRPRDIVHFTVEVKDLKGKPVKAAVNLNLVDEALYSLRGQDVNLLSSLYGDYLWTGIINSICTHKDQVSFSGGAEMGGEGGAARTDFKDAVYFKTIETDRNGKVQGSFQVPDNLTSWRLTYQAVTSGLEAGSGTVLVQVKLPFFISVTAADSYLSGDQPEIFLKSLGTRLEQDTKVKYTVNFTGAGEEMKKTVEGRAFESLAVSLPVLKKGVGQLTVTAQAENGLSDTMTLDLPVVDSFMVQDKTDFYLLENGTKITGSKDSPTTLVFTDYEHSRYLQILYSLVRAGGSRLEQRLAAELAGETGRKYFPDDFKGLGPVDLDPLLYQNSDGGLALLPYGSSELELSAKAAALCPEKFDTSSLSAYFTGVLNDPEETRERSITALYGLAALGEPVLTEITLAGQEKDLSVKERLYLILASVEAGNEQPAEKELRDLLKEKGEEIGPLLRVNIGLDQDDVIEATALAALAACSLGMDEQHRLQQYIVENKSEEILVYLEQLNYVQKNLSRLSSDHVSFTYSIGEKTEKVDLEPGGVFSLTVLPEKLAALKFFSVSGKVGVVSYYRENFSAVQAESIDGVVLERNYLINGQPLKEFSAGDLVMVKLSYRFGDKAPQGTYRVTDYLPAGLKIIEKPFRPDLVQDKLGWPVEIDGQKAVFLVFGKGSLHYYARVVNSGSFTAENAVIQHAGSGKIFDLTARDTVVIK